MLEQFIGELVGVFDWVTTQLGWEGSLGWFQILLLVLAVVGALVIARNLIGGSSGRGGGYTSAFQPSQSGPRGLPTSYYVGSKRLGDFSIKSDVYDFRIPSPKPNLSKLREPIKLDLEKAKKLFFIPPVSGLGALSNLSPNSKGLAASHTDNVNKPQGDLNQKGQQDERMSSQEKENVVGELSSVPAGPDWELARKLFVGKRPRLW